MSESSDLDPRLEALRAPLDPALVQQRRGGGGRMLSYLPAWACIDAANRIFGPAGWWYEIRELTEMDSGVRAVVRLAVDWSGRWVLRDDVGFTAYPGKPVTSDGVDMAFKGAVSDALRRCLRTWGPQFGLHLYGGPPAPDVEREREDAEGAAQRRQVLRTNFTSQAKRLALEEDSETVRRKKADLLNRAHAAGLVWGDGEFVEADHAG